MKFIKLFLILSIILLVSGFLILNSDIQAGSTGELLIRVGKALVYGMGALAIVFLVLLSAQQAVPTWKKFAKWYIPFATLFFIFYSDPGSGNYFAPYPEQVFKWLSGIYVVASFWIIGRVVLSQKHTNS